MILYTVYVFNAWYAFKLSRDIIWQFLCKFFTQNCGIKREWNLEQYRKSNQGFEKCRYKNYCH